MTGAQLFEVLKASVSEQNNPGWYPEEYTSFVNASVLEFVQEWSHKFEQDETARRKVDAFIKVLSIPMKSAGRIIGDFVLKDEDVDTQEDLILRILGITALWEFSCRDNSVTTQREIPVRPITRDSIAQLVYDPYNAPTDAFPVYVEQSNDGAGDNSGIVISIRSTTVPIAATVHYLKKPNKIVLEGDGSEKPLQFRDEVAYEIIERVVRKIASIVQNGERYQMQYQVETPIKEN